jgi:hypothetical protein
MVADIEVSSLSPFLRRHGFRELILPQKAYTKKQKAVFV